MLLSFFFFSFGFPGAHFLLCRRNKSESASDHVGLRGVKQKARVESLPDPIWIQLPARISAPLVCSKKSTLPLNMRLVRQISRRIHALCVLRPVLCVLLQWNLAETLLNPWRNMKNKHLYNSTLQHPFNPLYSKDKLVSRNCRTFHNDGR